MAVTEHSALLMRKDSSGNKQIIYPITNLDSVDGAETLPRLSATPTVDHVLKVASVAEDGTVTVEGMDASNIAPIKYIESLDQDNVVNLRDLESGNYILYGYFRPYAGASNVLTFSSQLLVGVITKTAGTHVQVIYPLNNVIQFLEIMVDSTQDSGYSYKRTDVKLSELVSTTALTTELANYLSLSGGTMNDADIDGINAIWLRNLMMMTDDDQELLVNATNPGETDPEDDATIFEMNFETRTRMRNVADPVEDTDVATKRFVESAIADALAQIPYAEDSSF